MGCLALRRSWKIDAISFAYLPSRAVGVTAPFCLHLSIRAFAAYTQQSWTSGQVQSAWYSVRD